MCKSDMNMLIRTLAEENDKNLYVYAISLNDGASRIIYPIVRHKLGHPLTKDYIVMYNYKPCNW
jgi:hypothetical protein